MNTLGMIRGYMAKNMKGEDFLKKVLTALGEEFETSFTLNTVKEDSYKITFGKYKLDIDKQYLANIQSAYGVDKYILIELEKQGFIFDRYRSQYIRYCFGLFKDGEVQIFNINEK